MSYDLLIFEPDSTTDEDFPQWWKQVVAQWDGPRDFSTIDGSTPAIRSIYRDLIRAFPPFNGPDALSEAELEEREVEGLPVADYTIGADYIYISVGWSRSLARWPGRSDSRSPMSARTTRSSGPSGEGADAESRAFDPASATAATK